MLRFAAGAVVKSSNGYTAQDATQHHLVRFEYEDGSIDRQFIAVATGAYATTTVESGTARSTPMVNNLAYASYQRGTSLAMTGTGLAQVYHVVLHRTDMVQGDIAVWSLTHGGATNLSFTLPADLPTGSYHATLFGELNRQAQTSAFAVTP